MSTTPENNNLEIYIPLVSLFITNFSVFMLAVEKRDNSLIDTYWSANFIVTCATIVLFRETMAPRALLVTGLVTLWGLRLTVHIALRHAEENREDPRFAEMRRAWAEAGGEAGVLWRSYLFLFLPQVLVVVILGSAAFYACLASNEDDELNGFDFNGILLFLIGLSIETVADFQLREFRRQKRR